MAYRFNPPPNWPVGEPGWTPPPGWQPDPTWGPAPEGWTFWTDEADAPQADAPAAAETADPARGADDLTVLRDDRRDDDSLAPATDATGTGASLGDASDGDPSFGEAPAAESADPGASSLDASAAPSFESDRVSAVDPGADPGRPVGDDGGTDTSSAPETIEASRPDLDSDLRTDAPYESATPAASEGTAGPAATAEPASVDAGAYGAAATAGSGQGDGGYGQSESHVDQGAGYGTSGSGYGQSANGVDQGVGYGQASPGYGASTGDDGRTAYGSSQPSPASFGSPSEPGSWQAAPGGPSDPQAPRKSFLARFWWLGCIILALLALIIALVGFFLVRSLGADGPEPSADGTTTTSSAASSEPSSSDPATSDPATSDPAAEPVAQPTIDPAAPEQPVVGNNGKGAAQVQMQWMTADQLPSEYGGTLDPGENPEYLVVTAKVRADEGTLDINPFQFAVMTPYGGSIEPATPTFGLADNGIDTATSEIPTGQEHTIRMVYDLPKNPGLRLEYDPRGEKASWDVPV